MKYLIKRGKEWLTIALTIFFIQALKAQSANYNQISGQDLSARSNPITTAVPFLMISPDARAGGMGDGGVASSADANSIHWNASKLAFIDNNAGFSLSYVPWLRAIVPDMNLFYFSGYYKAKSLGTFAGSLRYFSMGQVNLTDQNGNALGTATPNEFAIDGAYAKKFSPNFSMGGAVRYINSNLTKGVFVNGSVTQPAWAVAVDVSATYKKDDVKIGGKKAMWTAGLNISNLGNKMTYTTTNSTLNTANFLPANMRLGGGLTVHMDEYNSICFMASANKLLVPTPPIYELDANGNPIPNGSGGYEIAAGKNPNVPVATGVFQSFNDAPGGFKEELHEINYSFGLEYLYNKIFALRTGYFYENPTKGNRQYITMGAGIKYSGYGFDFAYLIPTSATNVNPLSNSLRLTVTYDIVKPKAAAPDQTTN